MVSEGVVKTDPEKIDALSIEPCPLLRPKKICVFSVTSPNKIGLVGRYYYFLFFFIFNFLFSLILPRNTTDALFARCV